MLGLSIIPAALAAIRDPTTRNAIKLAQHAAPGHQSSLSDQSVSGESARDRRQILRKRAESEKTAT